MSANAFRAGLVMGILVLNFPAFAGIREKNAKYESTVGSVESREKNPYSVVIIRNVFKLTDPPSSIVTPPMDEASSTTVKLTGLAKTAGQRTEAFFVSIPNHPNQTNIVYYTLSEGEQNGLLKLVKINEGNESAEVLYAGVRKTVLLKDSEPPHISTGMAAATSHSSQISPFRR